MSTPHNIPHDTPRFQIRLGMLMTALGVLIAIAVTIVFLALAGTHRTNPAAPMTGSHATSSPTPQTLPSAADVQKALDPQSGTPTAGAGDPAPHYTCLGAAQRCHR